MNDDDDLDQAYDHTNWVVVAYFMVALFVGLMWAVTR